jgi:prepilin-type N-terminal cleavage/methylation domain-containing protein
MYQPGKCSIGALHITDQVPIRVTNKISSGLHSSAWPQAPTRTVELGAGGGSSPDDGLGSREARGSSRVRTLRRTQAGSGRQAGYTLIEMLIAMTIALVVVGGPLIFVTFSVTQQNSVSSRTFASRQGAALMSRFGRELANAQFYVGPTGSAGAYTDYTPLSITTTGTTGAYSSTANFYTAIQQNGVTGATGPTGATTTIAQGTHVIWTCTAGGSCVRRANGVSQTELTGVVSAQFTGTTGPAGLVDLVQVALAVQDTSQTTGATGPAVARVKNAILFQNAVDLRNYP